MNQDRLLELLGKKSAGELTLQEQIELNQLLQVDTDARSFAAALEAILTTSTTYRNAVSENETEDFIQKVHSKISKKKTRVRKLTVNWKPISAVAAILLLVFVGGIYYWGMNTGKDLNNVVVTKKGNKTNIVLPDGTKVWVNADSRLTYDQSFGRNTREVTLTGEAYFDVTHDQKHPFIVHTKNINIRVFGTAFNVRSYANEPSTQTTLVRGSIQVSLKQAKDKKIMLSPNEKLIVQNEYSGKLLRNDTVSLPRIEMMAIKANPVDSSVAETQWVNNKLVFDKERLENMIPVLERWYNVKIILKNTTISKTFSGRFENENLEDVLQSLQLSAGIKYRIEKNNVFIY